MTLPAAWKCPVCSTAWADDITICNLRIGGCGYTRPEKIMGEPIDFKCDPFRNWNGSHSKPPEESLDAAAELEAEGVQLQTLLNGRDDELDKLEAFSALQAKRIEELEAALEWIRATAQDDPPADFSEIVYRRAGEALDVGGGKE